MPLRAESISKRSGTGWALKDVSFEAYPGQIIGLLGASDSGRRELLDILSGRISADSGKFVLDSTALPDPASIRARSLHVGDRDGYVRRWFRRLLRNEAGPKYYSDPIAAMSASVPLVLFDASRLTDRCRNEEMFDRIRAAARDTSKYVIFGTGSGRDALCLCDRIVVLAEGKVLQFGTPAEVYMDPASTAAAELTGAVNLFEARRVSSSKAPSPEFHTVKGDHRLTAERTEKSKLGAIDRNVKLAVRPEHISISFGASFPEDNLLKAVVTDVRFHGPLTLVKLDANGLELDALVMRLVGLEPGDDCMLGIPPDRIKVFVD